MYEIDEENPIAVCQYAYNAEYKEIINTVLLFISMSITIGFIILYAMKENIFMLGVVYLENFIISMSMVVFFSIKYNFIADDPFLLKVDNLGYFSYVLPFCPFSSILVHIPIPISDL